jgi:fumarate reductase subunit C
MSATRPDPAKLYRPKMSAIWYLQKRSYFLFMVREFSSLFIALFLVVYLVQLSKLAQGVEAYREFAARLASPGWLLFHLIALAFALFHTVTWFQSSAVVLPLRIGERPVPRRAVVLLHFAAWALVSLAVLVAFWR